MPLTKAEGLLLSNDELLAHLLENEARRIQLAERLPFFPVNGHSLRVERSQLSDFGTDPLFDTVPVTVTEGKATPTSALETSFELKLLVQDVIVNDYVAYNQSNVNSQVGVQLEAGTRRMLYKFWKAFGTGRIATNAQEFDGVRTFAPTGSPQTISANDTTNWYLDLIDLARLVAKVTANNGRPHVLWTSPAGLKNIQKAYFDKGLEPEYVMINVPDSNGGFTQRPCLAFQGIPVYVDEFYPAVAESGGTGDSVGTFTDGTSIYAMVLGRGGLYGIVPASFGQKMIRVKEVLVAGAAQTTFRVYWPCGLVLEKQDAIARLKFRAHPTTA
jgi:hypothetical protein